MKKQFEAVPVEEEKEFDLPPFAKVVVAFRKQEWKGLEPGYIQHIRATKDEVLARRQMIETKIEFWLREVEVGSSVSTGVKENLREQFKKERPETIGEIDKAFDDLNYIEWLETRATNSTEDIIEMIDSEIEKIRAAKEGHVKNMLVSILQGFKSQITDKALTLKHP